MKVVHQGHVVEWNGDFRFDGDPDGALEVVNAVPSQAVGAAFLSGCTTCRVVHVDESGEERYFGVYGPQVAVMDKDWNDNERWVLCGPGVRDGRIVAHQCAKRRAQTMSVCPIVDELAAFGYLVGCLYIKGLAKPRMTRFCEPYGELEGEEGLEFNQDMEGDAYGKMAHLAQSGIPVFNQIMRTRSINAFYGRVISVSKWWGTPIFLMRRLVAQKYFPTEFLSLREYAAGWVPVSVKNTDRFSMKSGFGGEYVSIFVPSEMTPGLGSFLRFLEAMGGMDFAASSDPKFMQVGKRIPLFRSLAGYNVSKEKFKEVVF